jgi:hypothetical protein
MRCTFCKRYSVNSKAVEHVIPESLGNVEHVLQRGVVCDGCNNYFASKIEEPLLADPYFRYQRSVAEIPSKKGRPARVSGVHPASRTEIEMVRNLDGSGVSIGAAFEKDEKRWIDWVQNSNGGRIYILIPALPEGEVISRFLGKTAIECLALAVAHEPHGTEALVDAREFDALREFARRGGGKLWPFHTRPLYSADFVFSDQENGSYEVLHEWTPPDRSRPALCSCAFRNRVLHQYANFGDRRLSRLARSESGAEPSLFGRSSLRDRHVAWIMEAGGYIAAPESLLRKSFSSGPSSSSLLKN